MTDKITESTVELAALEWFADIGYTTYYGPDISPGGDGLLLRRSFGDVILQERFEESVKGLNLDLDEKVVDEAIKILLRPESQDQLQENFRVHKFLVEGIPVETRDLEGQLRTVRVRLIDFEQPTFNDFVAINQFTVTEDGNNRRPDIVVFVNGLPIALLELKNPADENATLRGAWNQVQTYRHDIPSVFFSNELAVISDGTTAAMSSFVGSFEHYAPWKTIEGREAISDKPALEVLVRGAFEPERLLDIVQNFIVYSDETVTDKTTGQPVRALIKRVAKYHQYWAVNAAVESTVKASGIDGDRRGGVVWHTQGSGKSFEMVFYAAKIMKDPRMVNPTLVFLTDRNDLDDQLFSEVFAPASILPEAPVQAEDRKDLRRKLQRASGGIVFTTLHKFAFEGSVDDAELTDRANVVVVADEAHRSQYGFTETLRSDGTLKTGFAKQMRDALPNATYLGFTGTPIESTDKSTRAVFGDYIDVYDLTRAVEDGATVKIFYEPKMVKVSIDDADRAQLDSLAESITESVEESDASAAKQRWARLEAIVGSDERLDLVAQEIVDHWEKRREGLVGKGMIVAMSRKIAVRLYDKIVALRPEWHSDDPDSGKIKVVITGSAADPQDMQRHLLNKQEKRDLKLRAKDPEDELELVIVRDMWLTGFDSPSMHTMYVDKTMQGAGLMQAIARVNRTFRDKPGGLIVDMIGIYGSLQEALSVYSPSDRDQAGVAIEEVVNVMEEKYDIVKGMLNDVEYDSSPELPPGEMMAEYARVVDYVLADDDRTKRFNDQVLALAKAYALCASRDEAVEIHDDVRMFTDVRSAILKIIHPDSGQGGSGVDDIDTAISQLVDDAVSGDEVVDIYKLAGVENPELSILSDDFLDGLATKEKPNLQIGLLRRLLNDQIRTVKRTNVVQSRKFSEMLDEAVNRYSNRTLTSAEIIAELVDLAKQMRDDKARKDALGLNDDEIAFYDAIAQNESAVHELGDETLKAIAHDLVEAVRKSTSIDWNLKESVRAEMRSKVKRLLVKYGYPPDAEKQAVDLVLEQAELFAENEDSGPW